MLLATAAQMREADRRTIEEVGLPGIVLMENAAQGAARVLEDAVGGMKGLDGLDLAAFCGRGNNGGDGLAVCRILAGRGAACTAYLFCAVEQVGGDALTNLEVADACGVKVVEVSDEAAFTRNFGAMSGHDFYVDALLGTGLNAPARGIYAKGIELLNALGRPVLAVDIPSGLSADAGVPLGKAVRADLTVTFGLMKAGLALEPGEHVGEVSLVEIGIPPTAVLDLGIDCHLLDAAEAAACLNERPLGGHKGSFGHLLTVGGSAGFSGAACLMAMAGIKAGAGLVTAALPEGLNLVAEMKLTAAMTQPLPQTSEGALSLKALPILLELGTRRSTLALGPGLGQGEETAEVVRGLLAKLTTPVVVDADGLNALAGRLTPTAIAADEAVITPHPGEAARLLGCTAAEVQADRLAAARRLAEMSGAVAVLKGARTVVASPVGAAWINPTGNQLLASGGSGDVLTGLIGGLLAQGLTALKASLAGVHLHGVAADLAVSYFGRRGLTAEELVHYLPRAFASLEADKAGDGHKRRCREAYSMRAIARVRRK
jgi:NAD(P)H-hydrate epimerase